MNFLSFNSFYFQSMFKKFFNIDEISSSETESTESEKSILSKSNNPKKRGRDDEVGKKNTSNCRKEDVQNSDNNTSNELKGTKIRKMLV